MRLILIDNYDSFTFNLVECFKKHHATVDVYRNTAPLSYMLEKIRALPSPKCLVLSPGPGTPQDAGICLELVKQLYQEIPILGICLGHQVIGLAFDAKIATDGMPLHGKACQVNHNQQGIFSNLPSPMEIGRYHSLYVKNLPLMLECIADYQSMVMAIRHRDFPVIGLQFHPESILTPYGEQLLENFMRGIHEHFGKNMSRSTFNH